jgi:hypothetical protein
MSLDKTSFWGFRQNVVRQNDFRRIDVVPIIFHIYVHMYIWYDFLSLHSQGRTFLYDEQFSLWRCHDFWGISIQLMWPLPRWDSSTFLQKVFFYQLREIAKSVPSFLPSFWAILSKFFLFIWKTIFLHLPVTFKAKRTFDFSWCEVRAEIPRF